MKAIFLKKMNRLALLTALMFAFAFCQFSLAAAQFKVVYIRGKVERKANSKELSLGDMIDRNEALVYKTDDALVAIYNDRYGRVVLPDMKDKQMDFAHVAAPVAVTRNCYLEQLARILREEIHFNGGRYIIMGDAAFFDLKPALFAKFREQQLGYVRDYGKDIRFSVEYVYRGDTLRNDLTFDAEDLVLHLKYDEMYHDKFGQLISQYDVMDVPRLFVRGPNVCATTDKAAKPEPISVAVDVCNPVFMSDDFLRNGGGQKVMHEVEIILNALFATPGKVSEDLRHEIVRNYIRKYYGDPLDDNLRAWMARQFSMVKKD